MTSIARTVILISLIGFLSGCGGSGLLGSLVQSRCNQTLLDQVKNTTVPGVTDPNYQKLGAFTEMFEQVTYANRIKNLSWKIADRAGKGCVISLQGEVNAVPIDLISYFLDFSDNVISGDNAEGNNMMMVVGQMSHDLSLTGIKLEGSK